LKAVHCSPETHDLIWRYRSRSTRRSEIERRLGPDQAQWQWGKFHQLTLTHPLGQIVDVGNWDRSVMTNVPGESGDPSSKPTPTLLAEWAAGKYHPMPFSRKAVESAMVERIILRP
jgi:acyl-homoserine lactone acylase PvdQ